MSVGQQFENTLKDLYSAERQFQRFLPNLQRSATDSRLKTVLQSKDLQVATHVLRLEELADEFGFKSGGKICKSSQDLLEETMDRLSEGNSDTNHDAAIIWCVRRHGNYEICSCLSLIGWARDLGRASATKDLEQTLSEEDQSYEVVRAIPTHAIAYRPVTREAGGRRSLWRFARRQSQRVSV